VRKNPDYEEETREIMEALATYASLTEREKKVLKMRFGIGMNKNFTMEQVGNEFGVTRERIRQIIGKALRKIHRYNLRPKPWEKNL